MLGFNGGLLGKERRRTRSPIGATGLWLPNEQSVAMSVGDVATVVVETLNSSATLQLLVTPVDFL
jgi:hypothetical protein